MFEYICEFERWKKINPDYKEKMLTLNTYIDNCIKNCQEDKEKCIDQCRRPLVDIERFNVNMIKRLSLDVYEICSDKIQMTAESNFTAEVTKMKTCVEHLYRENEVIVKKETLERMSDMIKFLNA